MKTLSKLLLSLNVFFGLLTSSLMGDPEVASPYYLVPEGSPSYCLEVIPFFKDGTTTGKTLQASVRCLSFTTGEKSEQLVLWKTDILCPKKVYLSSCGKIMVAYHAPHKSLAKEKLAEWPIIEFYIEGKSIRKKTLRDIGVDFERIFLPNSDFDEYVVLTDVRIIDESDEHYPSSEELIFYDPLLKPFASDKQIDQLLYITVDSRAYYFNISDGELAFKKLVSKHTK